MSSIIEIMNLDDDTEFANDIREFVDAQSSKLGMEPKKYFEKHYEKTQETNMYIIVYIQEVLGDPNDVGEEYSEKANEFWMN